MMKEIHNATSASGLPEILKHARAVIVCGISGSGKTRLAHALELTGAKRISADVLAWQRHRGDFSSLPRDRQQRLFADVREDIDLMAGRLLDEGVRIVIDATNCKRQRRDRLRQVCREHGVEPLLVYLPATFATLHERLSSRCGSGPDDIVIPDSDLHGFCSGFEPPAADEPHITL